MSSLILVFEPVHCVGVLFKQVLQLTVQWDHDLNQDVCVGATLVWEGYVATMKAARSFTYNVSKKPWHCYRHIHLQAFMRCE